VEGGLVLPALYRDAGKEQVREGGNGSSPEPEEELENIACKSPEPGCWPTREAVSVSHKVEEAES